MRLMTRPCSGSPTLCSCAVGSSSAAGTSATPPASASRPSCPTPSTAARLPARNARGRRRPARRAAGVPDDYPLPITWPGILVSDLGHPEDIVARVRDPSPSSGATAVPPSSRKPARSLAEATARLLRREEIRRPILQRPPHALQQEPSQSPALLATFHRIRKLYSVDLLSSIDGPNALPMRVRLY